MSELKISPELLQISPEVQDALKNKKPVVALESTIISHGMPFPQNAQTAIEVEETIRKQGAVPATIAIIGGVMKVGLSKEEIELLGREGHNVTKVSRRDLPFVVAAGKNGATTVASTMIIAALAGIKVFATGGIGGVHRGAEHTFDISADLQELANTNVTVVCAGAKSILDLGLTTEYLETFGVPLIGYQTKALPAFFCRTSPFEVSIRLDSATEIAHKVMSYSDAGSAFIFGSLVGPKMDVLFDGAGFIFAFRVLPAIIFVTALISLLYYIGVMGLLIRILGSIFQKALNISKIESFVAVTTIFLGQNEIPAIVKPFIDRMNRNELFTAICSGMASIAGSMMIGYAGMGVPIDYLLAASLMAIPGGILFARILSPATEPSQVTFENLSFSETPPKSFIEAAASGAMTGLKIAAGVATVVMAFVAIIALINGIIGGIGGWFGFANASLESIFGYVLAPLAWIMGVDWSDANLAGSLIGQKLAINEFVAYLSFSPYLQTGGTLEVKTIAIISFALCGFANFGSIGVVVGAFSAISPKRAPEIAQLGLRALAAATLSNLMSATIAGFFIGLA